MPVQGRQSASAVMLAGTPPAREAGRRVASNPLSMERTGTF